MGEWKNCTLSSLGTIVGGATPSTKKPENYEGGEIPWITPKDLSGFSGRYISCGERNITEIGLKSCSAQMMPKHSVLFSSRAPIGYVAISNCDVSTNQGFKSIVPNNDTDYLFLYYLLLYKKHEIENLGSGTTFKEVSASTMKGVEVRVPIDKREQERIAGILSALDDKIESNAHINENLYDQMLTIFNNARDTASWNRRKLSDVLTFFDNLRKPLSSIQREKMEHIYPYYGATSIVDYVEDYLFEGTYILVSEDGANVVDPAGHPLTQYTHGKFWVNNHAHIVKGTNGYSEALVYALLGTLNMQSIVTGAAQPKINQANLRNFEAVLPESNEAQELSNILNPMLQQMILNDQENERLSALRDTLLPQLMSGLFDISGIEL